MKCGGSDTHDHTLIHEKDDSRFRCITDRWMIAIDWIYEPKETDDIFLISGDMS